MDFLALTQQCAPQVAPQTMAAIVRTESGFRPLAIGVNGGARLVRQPDNIDEAVVTARWLIGNGYNIDMGLGQVNSSNLQKTGLAVEDAFDPCKNLAASAKILFGNYRDASRKIIGEQAALHAAISAYNTGNFSSGFSNGYVQRVVSNIGVVPSITPTTASQIAIAARVRPHSKVHNSAPIRNPKTELTTERKSTPANTWDVYQSRSKSEIIF